MNQNTVRTFRAQDPKAALDIVKAMMGPDAIIISTREVGGNLFKRGEIEISAAMPHESPPKKENKRAKKQALAAYGSANTPSPNDETSNRNDWIFEEWENSNNALGLEAEREVLPQEKPLLQVPVISKTDQQKIVKALSTEDEEPVDLESIEPKNMRSTFTRPFSSLAENAQALLAATQEHTTPPQKPASQEAGSSIYAHMPPHARQLMRELQRKGLTEELAEDIIDSSLSPQTTQSHKLLRKEVAAALRNRLHAMTPPWKTQRRKVMALVGPTGVGKTTTIAKIAARAIIESSLSVALISIDTFRIGATEQLKRYGDIMAAPAFVCRNAEELKDALEQTSQCDLVLIDTAGRADKSSILKQAQLLESFPEIEVYLTLSLASGPMQMAGTVSRYRTTSRNGVIMTKLDESFSPGSLFSAEICPSSPICCYTDGQTVPEDLHAPDSQKLVSEILAT